MSNFLDKIFTNADQEVVEYNGEPVNWRVSAYVLVVQEDSLLIIKNKNEKLYDVPGGGVELGETIAEAIHREAMEEAGAKVKIGKLIHVQEGFFKHVNSNYYQTIQFFYTATLIGRRVDPTERSTVFVDFVKLSELELYPLSEAVKNAIQTL